MTDKTCEVDARYLDMLKELESKARLIGKTGEYALPLGMKMTLDGYDAAVERDGNPLFGIVRKEAMNHIPPEHAERLAEAICDAVNASAKPPANTENTISGCRICGRKDCLGCASANVPDGDTIFHPKKELTPTAAVNAYAKPAPNANGLLPCPFCGNKNIDFYNSFSAGTFFICCESCKGSTTHFGTVEDATKNWNRRAVNTYRKPTPRKWTYSTGSETGKYYVYVDGRHAFDLPPFVNFNEIIDRLNRLEETRG